MHLTRCLLRRFQHWPGLKYSGKKRFAEKISMAMKVEAVRDLIRTDKNAILLSKPFLTEEQEHYDEFEAKDEELLESMKEKQRIEENWKKKYNHYTTAEHLDHLNTNKKWE